MGTKLETAVNLIAIYNYNSEKLSTLNEWGACLKADPPAIKDNNSHTAMTDFWKLQNFSMDQMVNDIHSLESIKKAMLEHDQIFKQQVKELHRLYGVQKMLMTELKYNETRGTCSEENRIKQGCFDFEWCAQKHNTGGQKQAWETRHIANRGCSSNYDEEDADIDLTLSIGNPKNSNKRMKKNDLQPHCNIDLLYSNSMNDNLQIRCHKGLSSGEERSLSREECSEIVVTPDQERRPHWLLRSLSSHKT